MTTFNTNQAKLEKIIKKDLDLRNSYNYARYNSEINNNIYINSFNSTLNNKNENKNILSNYNNSNDCKSNQNTIIEDEKNNEYNDSNNENLNDNPTNIDEIIKNQMSSAVIDSFLNQNQIKSIPMFILYLSEIWKELSKNANIPKNKNLGINLFSFNKYYNLPGLIGQRLFKLMDLDNNGFLSPKEFISGMCILFCEEINSLTQFIFNFYDFDNDEYISFDDIHAVLSYLPIINGFDDMIDIEEEIYSTIQDIFINKKETLDYNTFYDLIIRKERYELFIPLISFFYDNKPFNNEEINEFYIGYYNMGKINDEEVTYEISNVVNLKEAETKEENENVGNLAYKSNYYSEINFLNKIKKNKYFENGHLNTKSSYNQTQANFNVKNIQNKLLRKINEESKGLSKQDYEKFVLNSNGFEQMKI